MRKLRLTEAFAPVAEVLKKTPAELAAMSEDEILQFNRDLDKEIDDVIERLFPGERAKKRDS